MPEVERRRQTPQVLAHDWVFDWAAAEMALDLGLGAPDQDYTVCRWCGQTERKAELGDRRCRGSGRGSLLC
jgi:hypothetical protein